MRSSTCPFLILFDCCTNIKSVLYLIYVQESSEDYDYMDCYL